MNTYCITILPPKPVRYSATFLICWFCRRMPFWSIKPTDKEIRLHICQWTPTSPRRCCIINESLVFFTLTVKHKDTILFPDFMIVIKLFYISQISWKKTALCCNRYGNVIARKLKERSFFSNLFFIQNWKVVC